MCSESHLEQACPLKIYVGRKVRPPGRILIIFSDDNQGRIQKGRGDRSFPSEKNDNIFNCYQEISYREMSKYNSF